MKINEMTALLSGEARTAAAHADAEITSAYAGDMLSDVLALGSQPDVLLTGLLNPQVIRTAEMLDTACVVFLRGKEPEASILELAEKCGTINYEIICGITQRVPRIAVRGGKAQ